MPDFITFHPHFDGVVRCVATIYYKFPITLHPMSGIHDIVLAIYTDKRVNEFIRKQKPTDLQEDLLHHCITELYRLHEKYPGKIEELFSTNKLWPYFHGMACMQLKSKTSTFYRKFRRTFESEDKIPVMIAEPYEFEINKVDQAFVEYVYSVFENRTDKVEITFTQIELF
jgi:hypothetical protein